VRRCNAIVEDVMAGLTDGLTGRDLLALSASLQSIAEAALPA
jgi:hypothetical protein